MNNVVGTVEVALNVFGGQNIEIAPSDLPQGLSPDLNNVAFLPGSVFSRPPLERLLTYPDNCQILYAKSYTKRDGTVVQIILDSLGRIWADSTQIGSTAPGNRMKSVTAFGREYIALSDGLHGADVPLQYDGTNLDRISQDGPGGAPTLKNVPGTAVALTQLQRASNVVTATTQSPHGLLVGREVQVTQETPYQVGISSISIANETTPDTATVVTAIPHGFAPGATVGLINVPAATVGGGIANTTRFGGILTVTSNSPNGLGVGATVALAGTGGDGTANGVFTVATIESTVTFTVNQPGTDSPTGGSAGNAGSSIQIIWPASIETAAQSQFTILTCPTPTTFQVQISYPDGVWTGGLATFDWDGSFYVASVTSLNSFTYAHAGPDATISGGELTPLGLISPGQHSCVVIFQTRNGAYTAPGPPVTITANGGQYLRVDNVPLGPPNVVARALAFTGASGAKYFILPIAPQLNGQILGTSTVINDNTTTSAVFDFSDQSLLAGLSIDTSGNDLFNQVVLGPVVGIFPYAGRLFAWGERNKIQQFLNLGFEGGYSALAPTQPLGWSITGTGSLVATATGQAWQSGTAGTTSLSQSAYQDQYGVAILQPNTQYTFRCYATGPGHITAAFTSGGTVLASATVPATGFVEAQFSVKTPLVIPSDTLLNVGQDPGITLDDQQIYYTDNPYLQGVRASYVNNPEAFDEVTGLIGPANDPHSVLALFERKDVLHMLTSGPDGSLYETVNTPSGEPSTWNINHVAAKCGASSVWGDAQFEDWQVWASDTGLRIYDGGAVEKMSQEVQPWWDSFNPLAKQFTVVANDPYLRRIYILSATGAASIPNSCYVLDYRELNTASVLANSGTLRVGYGGKVFTTDLTRKWSPWSILSSYCGLLSISGVARMVICSGSGNSVTDTAYGAIYGLSEGTISTTDADYGFFSSYYTTYFFLSQDEAQQMHLGTHRKLFKHSSYSISGTGAFQVTPLIDRLGNEGRPSRLISVAEDPDFDYEIPLNVSGDRVAFKISGNGGFYLTAQVVSLVDHPFSPLRGSNRLG